MKGRFIDHLLTHRELADLLRVSVEEVHVRRRRGDFPYLLLGAKSIRYEWSAVNEALHRFERSGPSKASPNPKARKAPEVAKSDG